MLRLSRAKKKKKFETLAGGWDFLNSGGGYYMLRSPWGPTDDIES